MFSRDNTNRRQVTLSENLRIMTPSAFGGGVSFKNGKSKISDIDEDTNNMLYLNNCSVFRQMSDICCPHYSSLVNL